MQIFLHTKHDIPEHVYQLALLVGQLEAQSDYQAQPPLIAQMRDSWWTIKMRVKDNIKGEVHLYLTPITD